VVVEEERLTVHPARVDVVDPARESRSQRTRHVIDGTS
jgi:hypothetical protein